MNRRTFLINAASAAVAALSFGAQTFAQRSSTKKYEFINGKWFDGQSFQPKRFYSVDGFLTSRKPASVDQTFDLAGKYIVPPFGDAHNHTLSGPYNLESSVKQFLKDGIFYLKNPAGIQRDTNLIKSSLNKPDSIDAIFANGPLAASGGHPLELYAQGAVMAKVKKPGPDGSFENVGYYIADNKDDLQRKWPLIMADKPDFLKTELLYSEEFAKRRDDAAYFGYKGLDPKLLPLIVAKAHENNLRVSCHIETAGDFRQALAAGVDEIAHMPGYYPDFSPRANPAWFLITKQDAALAARKKVTIVTTTYVSPAELKNPDQLKQAREIQIHNLKLLFAAGNKLAVGPDVYGVTSLAEIMNLYDLKVFNNLELLKMWCEATPQSIFPNRKIGHLKDGFEASFLILSENPLPDFTNTQKIERRFKQGEFLSI